MHLPGASAGKAWGIAPVNEPALVAVAPASSSQGPASSHGGDPEPPVEVTWPRFKARRLSLGPKGIAGLGPKRSAYVFGAKLGQGAHGSVWASSLGGHELAVKVFKEDAWADALFEASLAERLEHPNVVRLLDCVADVSKSFLVYERAEGSLHSRLKVEFPPPTTTPTTGFVAVAMRDLFAGVAYLHAQGIYHGDLKPQNVLVASGQGAHGRRFLVGDLGSCVEVGRCIDISIRLAGFNLTTLWYRSPELLGGQSEASCGTWLRADVWALGMIFFEVLGFTFHKVKPGAGEVQRLARALKESLGDGDDPSAPIRKQVSARPMEDRLGWAGVELLTKLTCWSAGDRPTPASCQRHPFVNVGCLRGIGDGAPQPGVRHSWRFLSGYMEAEILCWLRAEADKCLRDWKATATKPERLGNTPSTKYVLSGKVSDQCFSKSLNNRDVSKTLPAPRLCAFVNAFAAVNQPLVFEMLARIQARLERLRDDGEDIGQNGGFVLEKSVFQWFMVVGEIHIIDGPRGIAEPRHVDGAAGSLTMGITLFGNRDLRMWPRTEEQEKKEGVVDEPCHVVGLAPGSVYMGTLAGPEHQAAHGDVQDSLLCGHSVTLIVRTSLFPYNQSRLMTKGSAKPAVTFKAVTSEIVASLAGEWRLPTMAECLLHM